MNKYKQTGLVFAFSLAASVAASASLTPTYMGTFAAKLIEIKAADTVVAKASVWEGYERQLIIKLNNLELPSADKKAPVCEQLLAARALGFTQGFLSKPGNFRVQDLYMKNSRQKNATGTILTAKGSLAQALIQHKYARLKNNGSKTDKGAKTPWCNTK